MKIECKVFHRKDAKHAEMIHFFFAAETPAKKNAHALRARPDRLKGLTRSVRSFSFLPSQQKREKTFSSAISVPLAKRAVRHRSIHVTAKLDTHVKILACVDG
jgi:hypothetical protein